MITRNYKVDADSYTYLKLLTGFFNESTIFFFKIKNKVISVVNIPPLFFSL